MKRKLGAHDNLKLTIKQEGNKFTVQEHSNFRSIEIVFTLGVNFDYSLADGTELNVRKRFFLRIIVLLLMWAYHNPPQLLFSRTNIPSFLNLFSQEVVSHPHIHFSYNQLQICSNTSKIFLPLSFPSFLVCMPCTVGALGLARNPIDRHIHPER